MEKLYRIDWAELFIPTHSLAEIALRGTLMYLAIFLVFRFLLRQSGSIGIADLLVVVLIADASQNAFAREYKSVTEGLLLVLTIVFWDFMLDWLGYRSAFFARLTRPPPLPLVQDGKPLLRNLRREMIKLDELESVARKHGLEGLAEVKEAWLEDNGEISMIGRRKKAKANKQPRYK
jgi:uncharacterized membrane protein YcaP (DUF421 family)